MIGAGSLKTRFWWEGDQETNAFYIQTPGGATSWWELSGIGMRAISAGNGPLHWLTFQARVDVMCRLKELQLEGSEGSLVTLPDGYINCHWGHIRFDNWGDYAIEITTYSGQNLSTFNLQNFTADHGKSVGNVGRGFIKIDNTQDNPGIGTFSLQNGRIEINSDWSDEQAIFSLVTGDNPRWVALRGRDLTYQDVSGMSDDCFFYNTANTVVEQNIAMDNFWADSPAGGIFKNDFVAGDLALAHPSNGVYDRLESNGVPAAVT